MCTLDFMRCKIQFILPPAPLQQLERGVSCTGEPNPAGTVPHSIPGGTEVV